MPGSFSGANIAPPWGGVVSESLRVSFGLKLSLLHSSPPRVFSSTEATLHTIKSGERSTPCGYPPHSHVVEGHSPENKDRPMSKHPGRGASRLVRLVRPVRLVR